MPRQITYFRRPAAGPIPRSTPRALCAWGALCAQGMFLRGENHGLGYFCGDLAGDY
jgi:hypothetical protein